MAKVQAQVVGGDIKMHEGVDTIAELKQKLGLTTHQASVNGEPVDDAHKFSDYEFVTFAPKVKGATL